MSTQGTPLYSAFIAVCLTLSSPVRGAEADTESVEEIVVTGSRIPRPDFESASPIVTIPGEAFQQTASASVETVLGRLPQFVPDNGAFPQPSLGGDSGGRAMLNLRGLGAHSTLTLLDGRRLVPSFGDGAVDVNVIPPALIDSVEIISGGASAVYGSDAVAGVVNFKLRQRFEGIQLDGGWGQTDRDDGDETHVDITAGTAFADGRGQAIAYFGYADRNAVTLAERDFSRYALGYDGPGNGVTGPEQSFSTFGSFTTPEAKLFIDADPQTFEHVFAGYGFEAGSVPYQDIIAVNDDGTVFTSGNGDPGSVVNYRGPRDPVFFNDAFYSYNFNPFNYLQLPLERATTYGRASFEFTPDTEAYAQVLYTDYSADRVVAPTPAFSLFLPRSNPYIPADLGELLDSRADPGADVGFFKRFVELGPRVLDNDYTVYQTTVGLLVCLLRA